MTKPRYVIGIYQTQWSALILPKNETFLKILIDTKYNKYYFFIINKMLLINLKCY